MSDKPTIHEALSAVMAGVRAVDKRERNEQHRYLYRGIDRVVNAVSPALREQGVVVVPLLEGTTHEQVEVGSKRTPMVVTRVTVRYRFHGPAGDHLDAVVPGEAMDSGDKSTPKAMSVAYRTALLQVLTLPTDDPDPSSESYERSAPMTADELGKQAVKNRNNRDLLLALHKQATDRGLLDGMAANETGEPEQLGDLIVRLGKAAPAPAKRTAKRKPLPAIPEPDLDDAGADDE